jgi:hypothetical protein
VAEQLDERVVTAAVAGRRSVCPDAAEERRPIAEPPVARPYPEPRDEAPPADSDFQLALVTLAMAFVPVVARA